MPHYFRSVDSLAQWKADKEEKNISSTERASSFVRDVKRGTGQPSFWLPESEDDLEKISLGILLRKGHLNNINLVAFDEECFNISEAKLIKVEDSKFPIPSVKNLHYELSTSNDQVIGNVVLEFVRCEGYFKSFFKAKSDSINMRRIAAKYLNDVNDEYKDKVKTWAGEYL